MQKYVDISNISDAAMGEIGQILSDDKMASISGPNALGDRPTIPGGHFGAICSPFWRLSRAINGS